MIGIHQRTKSFSDRWVEYCQQEKIPYKLLNCLSSNIVEETAGLKAVLWHWTLNDPRELLFARQIIASLEEKGIPVFPNTDTCWHYDDKVAQKFLLDAIGAPLVPTWVFTDQVAAEEWIAHARWPKVFKLRCGAGSNNVRLVHSQAQASRLCRAAFGRGFAAESVRADEIRKYVVSRSNFKDFGRRFWRLGRKAFLLATRGPAMPRQRGYLYFQEFMPDNAFDTRVTVIGERAFAFTRQNRPGDFRASGSGRLCYDLDKIDLRCIEIAFNIARLLRTQSVAFDFLFDAARKPVIGEISYCYMAKAVHDCSGHWDPKLAWHEGHMWPQDAILRDLCAPYCVTRTADERIGSSPALLS